MRCDYTSLAFSAKSNVILRRNVVKAKNLRFFSAEFILSQAEGLLQKDILLELLGYSTYPYQPYQRDGSYLTLIWESWGITRSLNSFREFIWRSTGIWLP